MIITIIALVLMFKLTGFALKICGKLIGACLSIIGFAIIGGLAVTVLGVTVIALPVIFIVALVSIGIAIGRRVVA